MSIKDQLKIMVVDDMTVSRGLVARSLDTIGFKQVVMADHTKRAMDMLDASPVHLVISDFNMPDLDGLDLLLAIRKNQKTNKTGFILMSGKPTPIVIDLGKRLGMNNFLQKPFTDAQLKQCIESVTGPIG